MKRTLINTSIIIIILIIVFSGCVSESDDSTPDSSTPDSTAQLDPVQLLSTQSWTWPSRIRVKDVSISDDGEYIGGLTTQKAIIKTSTQNLLTNSVWTEGNFISISGSGDYIAITDKHTVNFYDNIGDQQYAYDAKGIINQLHLLDSGIIIQGGEYAPHLSSVDVDGNELWVWNPGSATTKVLDLEYSSGSDNMMVSTNGNKVYCLSNSGKYKWFKEMSGSVEDIEMSDNGERMYVLSDDGKVSSFDQHGYQRWEKGLDEDTVEIEIDKKGDYILTKSKNKVNLLDNDKNGEVKWTKSLSNVGVIDISEEAQYIMISDERDLMMYNLEGNELASYHLDSEYGNFFVCLAMTPDLSKIVLGTTNSMLVFG